MAILSISKLYRAGQVLRKSYLDEIKDSVTTFLNTTKLGYENIQIESTLNSLSQAQA